jgi:ATP-grasp domain, R2K clade family 2
MKPIEATKFYVRHREDYPETEVLDASRRGFWELNCQVAPYYWVDDIDIITDLCPTIGVSGWIGDVHRALTKLNKPIPINIDYPEELTEFLGRNIRKGTLGEVRNHITTVFVKPQEQKAFQGFVWLNDLTSRSRIVMHGDDVPVLIADPIEILSEHRSFILRDKVRDVRRYKGDWSLAPNRKIVESAAKKMKGHCPVAYCLDWGITKDGETVLVEMNEGFAFGSYGMAPSMYARMLSARWHEMTS